MPLRRSLEVLSLIMYHGIWCFFINLPCGALAAASRIFLFKVPDTIKPADATLKENFCEWIYRGEVPLKDGVTRTRLVRLLALRCFSYFSSSLNGIKMRELFSYEVFSGTQPSQRARFGELMPLDPEFELFINLGTHVGKIGVINPFLIVGGILTTISCGLLMTLQPDSPSSKWISYQALAGIGLGFCFNV
ncbi:hypothetical protein BGAL_0159g00050 [Botrytis galanthina]|uniref:Uncharacterized protein n=1 Tax=Botrytis galanthina TaxID=278940 RepID=A0A4S8QYW5_9HELO|nr:hypothetical protein BGAL_0159g00050 [Botrytis galanthina]